MNLARRYLCKQETGFTLVEVLVSAMMMFGVLFALYAIFDVSVRAFGYGGDRLEAVGNARLALGRMEREIRAAYPYDLTSDPPRRYLFLDPTAPTRPAVPTATRITFGNETGGNRSIDGSEVISYYLSGHDLKRSKAAVPRRSWIRFPRTDCGLLRAGVLTTVLRLSLSRMRRDQAPAHRAGRRSQAPGSRPRQADARDRRLPQKPWRPTMIWRLLREERGMALGLAIIVVWTSAS